MLVVEFISEKDNQIINGYFKLILQQETITDTCDDDTIIIPKIIIYNLIKSKSEVKKLFIGASSLYLLYMKGYSNSSRPNESRNEDEVEKRFESRILEFITAYYNELVPSFVKAVSKMKFVFEN